MPDSSIMLELCGILDINVNELLCGEVLTMENYSKTAEKNLIALKELEENSNRRLLFLESVIACTCTAAFGVMIPAAVYADGGLPWRIILGAAGCIIFLTGVCVALWLEKDAGYYECTHCGHRYIPTIRSVFLAVHYGRNRYMKCPECGKKSWSKKVLSK
ncbi:MAG: DNA-binding protein [Blautia sp.]